jgi:hypothetical protein
MLWDNRVPALLWPDHFPCCNLFHTLDIVYSIALCLSHLGWRLLIENLGSGCERRAPGRTGKEHMEKGRRRGCGSQIRDRSLIENTGQGGRLYRGCIRGLTVK